MAIAQTLEAYLLAHGAAYRLIAHARSDSSKQTAASAHVPEDHLAKAVMLSDAQGVVMSVVPGARWLKLNAVRAALNRHLELASEQEVDRLFADCQPGAIPPIGPAWGLETIVDEALTTLALVFFEAGDHRHLVEVSGEAFRALLRGARRGHFS